MNITGKWIDSSSHYLNIKDCTKDIICGDIEIAIDNIYENVPFEGIINKKNNIWEFCLCADIYSNISKNHYYILADGIILENVDKMKLNLIIYNPKKLKNISYRKVLNFVKL